MSSVIASVKQIENHDSLHIVKFDCSGQTLTMMSLDIDPSITIDAKVKLVIKPTHIAIAKEFSGEVSYSNQLQSTITSINNGNLLSSIKLDFFNTTLESIITVNSSKRMDLKVGDNIVAFVKASDLSIGEVIRD